MVKKYFFVSLLTGTAAWSSCTTVQAQELTANTVAGRVVTESDEPLVGATVIVKGTYVGGSTNSSGDFVFRAGSAQFPLTVVVSYLGYETQELVVQTPGVPVVATLIPQRALTNQLVMAASRKEENILQAPVTVEKVTEAQVRRLNTPDLVTGLAQFRGVDANASGFLINSLSTRGFGAPTSERVIQLVDYMDTQSPSISLNFGNALGIPDVDVASVEILSGPSSVLYGANAFNGVVLFNSKDAFTEPGLTVRLRGGERSYLDGQLRYAQRLGRRWAFKLTGSYLTADDWVASNFDARIAGGVSLAPNNPAGSPLGYDAVNRYGDIPFTFPVDPASPVYRQGLTYNSGLAGRTVYTPGYSEADLLADDRKAQLYRFSPSVSYLLSDRVKATLEYAHATGTATLQNTDRFRARDFSIDRFRFELISPDKWFVRAYQTYDDGNRSYDLTYLGRFLQQATDPRTQVSYQSGYFGAYSAAYKQARDQGASDAAALAAAQLKAKPFQPAVGTPAFEQARTRIINNNTPGQGAQLNPNSYLRDLSAQYNLSLPGDFAALTVGGAYREVRLGSDGNFFQNENSQRIRNYEYGGYAQATKTLLDERLKLALAGRLDNFKNFDAVFSPRASAVLSLGADKEHNFRFSFGQAFRSPTQVDQYGKVDLGLGINLGNVGAGFQGYTTQLASDYEAGKFPSQLALVNALPNYKQNVSRLVPEQVSSFEAGYKSSLADRLLLDLSVYYSRYQNFITPVQFIGNTDGTRPTPQQLLTFAQSPGGNPGQPTRLIQVASNLDQQVRTHGAVLALTYAVSAGFTLTGNYALNVLQNSEEEVPFFNTPKHKFNVGAFGSLTKALSYSVNYRYAEGYRYSSPFATGFLSTYQTVDAQLRYALPKLKSSLEVGGTNLFNTTNVQIFGGPQIGRLVYGGLTVTVK